MCFKDFLDKIADMEVCASAGERLWTYLTVHALQCGATQHSAISIPKWAQENALWLTVLVWFCFVLPGVFMFLIGLYKYVYCIGHRFSLICSTGCCIPMFFSVAQMLPTELHKSPQLTETMFNIRQRNKRIQPGEPGCMPSGFCLRISGARSVTCRFNLPSS